MTIAIDINDVIRDYTRQFIKYYKKGINPEFEIEYDDVKDFDFMKIFPFIDDNDEDDMTSYYRFKYEDYSYELFCRADVMERTLPANMNMWLQNTLRDFDENPDVIIVSPFEMNLSIQSTLSFLSRIGVRAREYYFPTDSQTIWDKCDILITANPNLIESKPDDKICFKINAPYNKETKCEYAYNTLNDIINDKDNVLVDIIEKNN